ncbi:alpha-1,3-mannosyl-glycoprotein 2-beta-N-acetylglucosaminyltransferase isoform X1 [Microplitis demolitor]|uniref:alpha-1,3-mannosyl-glycoprotein 2-beta-N-acetylglucosaminyltransferase isoform X1 n=1 Tax=Microplitis demolitor TaxID=69319 RepID=UPI0004CD0FA9|nr:alpha-1,3-mannosyl-glycoprotein 2-beta-N-acetylglucosaminyltransferase isoform X1 [Microplitis demolitor]
MRKKSIGLLLISLLVWGIITYFLFLSRTTANRDKNVLSNQINSLKTQVQRRIADNQILLKRLIELQQKKLDELQAATTVNNLPDDSINNLNSSYLVGSTVKLKTEEEIKREKLKALAAKKSLGKDLPIIAVLVISCNRITVERCLNQLIKLRTNAEQFPIIVSQDCEHKQTADIIKSFGDQVVHIQQPDQSDIDIPLREKKFKGYFKIARHYGWALNQIFFEFGFDTTIIVEDDLDVAPDFYEYFLGTYPLLVADKSLWCVSAWNDNGKSGLVDETAAHLLYRTDFFPGLGWMLTKDLWQELSVKWPKAYWDDWIRQPEQRKNRACIRPELSRTRTFGKVGVSNGLFYEKHLKYIKLNDQFVPFTKMNLSYLLKDNYDINFVNQVYHSTVVSYSELKSGNIVIPGSVRIPYHTRQTFKNTAKMLGLMDDFRSGVPRTGYRGVITFFYNNRRVHLAPNTNWNGYDISWN